MITFAKIGKLFLFVLFLGVLVAAFVYIGNLFSPGTVVAVFGSDDLVRNLYASAGITLIGFGIALIALNVLRMLKKAGSYLMERYFRR